jgi:hypothetical protein
MDEWTEEDDFLEPPLEGDDLLDDLPIDEDKDDGERRIGDAGKYDDDDYEYDNEEEDEFYE